MITQSFSPSESRKRASLSPRGGVVRIIDEYDYGDGMRRTSERPVYFGSHQYRPTVTHTIRLIDNENLFTNQYPCNPASLAHELEFTYSQEEQRP